MSSMRAAEDAPTVGTDLAQSSLDELKRRLGTSSEGLSEEEAGRRLKQYGYNELAEEKVHPLLKFLTYFWGPIPWMIEIAAILSAAVQRWPDFIIILVLLLANAVVGFWEEYQAGNAIAALKQRLALRAKAKRGGRWGPIAARELVPGDVVRLRIGDIVPADAKLLEGDPIEVDQSALTGESLPVTRTSEEAVYSGSIVRQGEIEALVYATGANTYFGKTAELVKTAHTTSHFQRAVLKIGDFLIVVAVALVILILAVALFRGDRMVTTLQFALVLTVAAIPVAMPTVLSVTMAVGARILSAYQAIVSRLASVEELAGMDVLCSDKTGTLTQNKLTLGEPFTVRGITADEALLAGALASREEDEDPIDLAVIGGFSARREHAAPAVPRGPEEHGPGPAPEKQAVEQGSDAFVGDGYQVTHFQPFDPVHKRTEATVRAPDGRQLKVTKGAPQVILELAANADAVRTEVDQAVNGFAKRGFRSLGVARTDPHDQWQFLGVLPLFDPPREDSRATIQTAQQMGSHVKMVTGDQMAIAREVAKQLGLGTNILDASLFADTSHHETGQLADAIEQADGFAQVYPEHKYHIVDVLQRRGHIVGMTGDGVNDAPALKKADVGIAVSGSTDAARAAADIVLLSPGLSVIINAIQEARKIFQRMNSYAIYRIAETIRVLLFMTLSILVFNFYPVTAVMIVLLALLNDGPILAIAYDRTRYSKDPETWNMPLVLGISTILGLAGVVASFGLFYLAERQFKLDREVIRTFMFLKLAVAGHLTIFITRTRGPFWSIPPAAVLLWAAIGTKVLATLAAVYGILMVPIGWKWSLLIWGYALAWFLVNDQIKLVAYRIFDLERLGLLSKKLKAEG
jgi:H+-transporting ATPase